MAKRHPKRNTGQIKILVLTGSVLQCVAWSFTGSCIARSAVGEQHVKQCAQVGRQHNVGFGGNGLHQKIGEQAHGQCGQKTCRKRGGCRYVAAQLTKSLNNAKHCHNRGPVGKMMNNSEAVFKAARHQVAINLKGANALWVRIDIPVCTAEVPHGSALHILNHPVEVAGHAVPFVGHGEQDNSQICQRQDKKSQKQPREQGFWVRWQLAKPLPGQLPALI